MGQKVKVWVLNRALNLMQDEFDKVCKTLDKAGFQAEIANRLLWNEHSTPPLAPSAVHTQNLFSQASEDDEHYDDPRLMYEGPDLNEYFVPIAVKTLGWAPDWLDMVPPSGRKILSEMIRDKELYPYFHDRQWFENYWASNGGCMDELPRVRMNTPKHVGYYQILREDAKKNDCQHILIGYSQGSLVARFLAFLDEHVFQENLIRGVVTIGSPSKGSPLAVPDPENHVLKGLNLTVMGLMGLDPKHSTNTVKAVEDSGITIQDIRSQLWGIVEDQQAGLDTFPVKERSLRTALKWSSGLEGDNRLAFGDLNMKMLEQEQSVLSLVNKYPLHISHGAVINGDSSLKDILSDVSGVLANLVLKILRKQKKVRPAWASDYYAQRVMHFPKDSSSELLIKLKENYIAGDESLGIEPLDHDFVIPSVSQRWDSQAPAFMGNWVNPRANHLSGSVCVHGIKRLWKSDPGRKSRKQVLKFLKMIQ